MERDDKGRFVKGNEFPREWYEKRRSYKGKNNPNFKYNKSNPPLCKCGCGETTKFNYALKKFCEYITGHNSKGKGNSTFNNWSSREPYGQEFSPELKEYIRQRDNLRCQQCFRHQDELFRNTKAGIRKCKLFIHHIDFNKKNNNPNNLISLCLNCHMQTNFNRENWTDYFQNKVNKIW